MALPQDALWYKDALIYQVHVRTFYDSTGDGIGDFRGLAQKLDYLQELGITAIWLMPFFPSPLRDDGYDIAVFQGRRVLLQIADVVVVDVNVHEAPQFSFVGV